MGALPAPRRIKADVAPTIARHSKSECREGSGLRASDAAAFGMLRKYSGVQAQRGFGARFRILRRKGLLATLDLSRQYVFGRERPRLLRSEAA